MLRYLDKNMWSCVQSKVLIAVKYPCIDKYVTRVLFANFVIERARRVAVNLYGQCGDRHDSTVIR